MKRPVLSIILLAFLSVGFQSSPTNPKEVKILLSEGTELSVEILSVRDSSIVIAREVGLSDDELKTSRNTIAVLPFKRVMQVETPGKSYTAVGLFTGMALGCIGGCAIGSAQSVSNQQNDTFGCKAQEEKSNNTVEGAAIGAGVGALVGVIVGGSISSGGTTLVSPTQRDFGSLNFVARYLREEPEFLKSITR